VEWIVALQDITREGFRLAGLAAAGEPGLPLFGVRPDGLEELLAQLPQARLQSQLTGFKAEAGQIMLLPAGEALAGAVLGLGSVPALHGFGAAAAVLPSGSIWHLSPGPYETAEAALGFLLGAYRYGAFKTQKFLPALLAAHDVDLRTHAVAAAICLARDLINTPANALGPAELAGAAMQLAQSHGARAERVSGEELIARYPAIAAVGAGSERAPEVVVLHWQGSEAGPDAPFISLCGKGVCFDTGGYDLKPSAAMLRMKKDMGGAAILIGLASCIMSLNLSVKLQLRIGCVENSISGHAMRPSDILRTRAGLTVEVGNTDAEGRLVLCDLLAEACEETPDWLIDAATLTGAARVALGPDIPALFCSDNDMANFILRAGAAAHDPLWLLPLHDSYASWLDSSVADLNNVSAKPFAGAIIAALFLKRFVSERVSWAHIDTYAWNDSSRPGRPEGGEAQTLRALLGALEQLTTHRDVERL
jgi:leucyl aminopeptidase